MLNKQLLLSYLQAVRKFYRGGGQWGATAPASVVEKEGKDPFFPSAYNANLKAALIWQQTGRLDGEDSPITGVTSEGKPRWMILKNIPKKWDVEQVNLWLQEKWKAGKGTISYFEFPIPFVSGTDDNEKLEMLLSTKGKRISKEVYEILDKYAAKQVVINPETGLPHIREWELDEEGNAHSWVGPVYRIKALWSGDKRHTEGFVSGYLPTSGEVAKKIELALMNYGK